MCGYVGKALQKLRHTMPLKTQYVPPKCTVPICGKNRKFAPDPDKTLLLPPEYIKEVQRAVGKFLYYGRAVDNTILPILNVITVSQAKPIEKTVK